MAIAAFTGHRPDSLGGWQADEIHEQIQAEIADTVRDLVENENVTEFVSGMALGVDQWGAAAVIKARDRLGMDLTLTAAVPFEGQADKWPAKSQQQHSELLALADEVVYVCSEGYAPWKFQRRNEWMVDRCDILVAGWTGKQEGGTYNCLEYAKPRVEVTYLDLPDEIVDQRRIV